MANILCFSHTGDDAKHSLQLHILTAAPDVPDRGLHREITFRVKADRTHPVHAIDAAGALFAATGTLNQENQIEPFALHMGMNSGAALVGSTRYEGRRGSRWIFTADGPVINLAARLAGIAEPGELLLGPGAAQRLADRYSLLNRGPVSLKNISEPVEVFCLPKIAIDLPQK
jgi:class 3 adenylate cyclase